MTILPVIELGKRDGTVQRWWFKSEGFETLGAGGFRQGNEIAGVVSGHYHGGMGGGVMVTLSFLYTKQGPPQFEAEASSGRMAPRGNARSHVSHLFSPTRVGACV